MRQEDHTEASAKMHLLGTHLVRVHHRARPVQAGDPFYKGRQHAGIRRQVHLLDIPVDKQDSQRADDKPSAADGCAPGRIPDSSRVQFQYFEDIKDKMNKQGISQINYFYLE